MSNSKPYFVPKRPEMRPKISSYSHSLFPEQTHHKIIKKHVLHAALGSGNLGGRGINVAKGRSLTVGQSVQGIQGNVEARGGVVDGEDIDALAVVLKLPAGAALGRVPAGNGFGTADVGELGNGALGLPALAGDEAVGAV